MTLPFSTQLNGKPTYFMEKIAASVKDVLGHYLPSEYQHPDYDLLATLDAAPKLHTIRTDKGNRWKKGVMIDFFINNTRPDMFRFAPRIPCTGTQHIFMTYIDKLEISIDSRQLTFEEINVLAKNDGFDTYEDFEEYFLTAMDAENEFTGKIIHWTDFRY